MKQEDVEFLGKAQEQVRAFRTELFNDYKNLIDLKALPGGVIEAQVSGDADGAVAAMIDDLYECFPNTNISVRLASGSPAFQALRRQINLNYEQLEKIPFHELAIIMRGQKAFLLASISKGSGEKALEALFPGVAIQFDRRVKPSERYSEPKGPRLI